MNKRILVTGGTGFVGRALLTRLIAQGQEIRAATRIAGAIEGVQYSPIVDIGPTTDWSRALEGISFVVHLAARAHQLDDAANDSLERHRNINTSGTVRLAQQALQAGVRRFIYLSTAKIYGEFSTRPFGESDVPNPRGAYALSKLEAEEALVQIGTNSRMEIVILRPPLIYGPGVAANFLLLMQHVAQERWLPLGSIRNERSLVGLNNLLDAIRLCITHPNAAGERFNVCDARPLSTPQLVEELAYALGVKARLVDVPAPLLRAAAVATGRQAAADRLMSSFTVDSSRLHEKLGWEPRSMREELESTVRWYRNQSGYEFCG